MKKTKNFCVLNDNLALYYYKEKQQRIYLALTNYVQIP